MTGRFHHVPLDHPYLERLEAVHQIDRDPETTIMAIGIVDDAVAAGHPDDKSAAERVLTGASGAAHSQAVMQPYLDEAIRHDTVAEEHGAGAVQSAQEALQVAEERRGLAGEAVQLSDGSSLTRGQVQDRHDGILRAAAQREGRGDFEHTVPPPGLASRVLVVTVLSVIEVFLLIWPVTDASWADPKSVAYVAGLVLLFLFMNEQLPKQSGLAVREAREAEHAAWENTRVGLSAGDPGIGRKITGHVDERLVRQAARRKTRACTILGAVLAVYSAVMFTRVDRLAAGLGWPLSFVLLAAALITAFTAGSVLVMTWRWSRGNKLGDQLREHGTITSQSRAIAEDLADQVREHARASADDTDQARHELDLAEQTLHHGYRAVGRGLQKAAKILDQDCVRTPRPENLFAAGRPIRDRVIGDIARAQAILAQAEQILTGSPFDPAGPAPNPWELRTAPRQARANPAFVDPYQLGTLHTPGAAPAPAWRRLWVRAAVGAALFTLTVLVATAILIHH